MGIERTKNKHIWGLNRNGEWDVISVTGMRGHVAFSRFRCGSVYEMIALEDFE